MDAESNEHLPQVGKLEHGSLLMIKGDLQRNWEQRIAKSTKPMRPRLNLTFRVVR